ncbi:hypothetical protein BDR26DRAFT_864842 [Obelidium mucronatum]|nr:hypothetical protein BDR26DRAFT_864842 [Obelidium mucronatum]
MDNLTDIINHTSRLQKNDALKSLVIKDYGFWALRNLYPTTFQSIRRKFGPADDAATVIPDEEPNRIWLLRFLFAIHYLSADDKSIEQPVFLESGLPNLDYMFTDHQSFAWTFLCQGDLSDEERFKVIRGLNDYVKNLVPRTFLGFDRFMTAVLPKKLGDVIAGKPTAYWNSMIADLILAALGKPPYGETEYAG